MGLDGRVEDETELEAIKEVVHEHSEALARLEDGLARVQVEAKADDDDLRQRLEDLMRAVASLQEQKTGAGGTLSSAELEVGGGSALGGAIGDEGPTVEAAAGVQGAVTAGQGATMVAAEKAPAALTAAEFGPGAGAGPVRAGLGVGPGLLPTPTAQEIAARKGKAKMPGYDTDGPPRNNGPRLLGHYTNVHNGLGWLELEDGPEYDKLGLADQQAMCAEPEMDQRGPGGPRRAADQLGQGGSAHGGRTEAAGPRWVRPKLVEPGLGGPMLVEQR
ncbi:unnamed protein product [Linum trigynum]|uniref:Uncharacterized protein n=1 Tax=Linum trigynum TaxID=586398 RepID=A0AAV2EDA3_9ROSI